MNKESQFYQVLVKIENGIKRMSEQAAAVRWYLEADDLDTAYDKALGLEAVTEKTTLLTRVLPAYTGYRTAKEDVAEIIANEIPVKIGFTAEGWFCLRMPTLLPKKSSGSHDYIRTYLLPAMDKFFNGRPRIRYRDCVLIVRHVYDMRRPERKMRDHDNIEVNMVTDIVASKVMPDDNPNVCFILAPIKGHEFRRACNAVGGQFIRIAPGSPHCINIMEIRHTIAPEMELIDAMDYVELGSMLANKIQQLMIFFSLLIPDMTNEEEQLLDEALIKTYADYGITHDNESVYEDATVSPPKMKQMPILGDLHKHLLENKMTERIAVIVSRFVTGSAQSFNRQTNVDLQSYIHFLQFE